MLEYFINLLNENQGQYYKTLLIFLIKISINVTIFY